MGKRESLLEGIATGSILKGKLFGHAEIDVTPSGRNSIDGGSEFGKQSGHEDAVDLCGVSSFSWGLEETLKGLFILPLLIT